MFEVLQTYFSPSTRIGGPAMKKLKDGSAPKPYFIWLLAFFVAWKLLLLGVACASPGPGYDTSTRILFDQYNVQAHSWISQAIERLTLRLTRWDALYFSTSSARGHLYEQEWAFSWFMSRLTAMLANVFSSSLHASPIVRQALSGILTSHVSHLGAVTTLYSLVRRIIPAEQERKQEVAFIAACLHTVSPAGLFLSAPYGESTFAFTTFLGILCYVRAQEQHYLPAQQSHLPRAAWVLLSGFSFALSTLFRSNGLLHGTIFLFDAITCLRNFFKAPNASNLAHLTTIIVAGSFIAIGFALPQAIAYLHYCTPEPLRPWCSHLPPSIYSWVQKHYWNVGFLSYWTPNNIPLFLIAAPMLAVLSITALAMLLEPQNLLAAVNGPSKAGPESEIKLFTHVACQMAVPQIVLAVMATTSFHVQIINRISSGCALWYIVLAVLAADRQSRGSQQGLLRLLGVRREVSVRVMVGYAVVQGGLYAAFLPPA
ncbi:hypothetical protein MBLNU13_g11414t1 [Cladosporium sp. NU13]